MEFLAAEEYWTVVGASIRAVPRLMGDDVELKCCVLVYFRCRCIRFSDWRGRFLSFDCEGSGCVCDFLGERRWPKSQA